IGPGQWLTRSKLPAKHRYYAAVAPEHVAKSNSAETGIGESALHLQHEQLSHSFGRPHDVSRPHGLVGADQYELRGADPARLLRNAPRPNDVVADCLPCVQLHHRDVLVRGCVEHLIWSPCVEHS